MASHRRAISNGNTPTIRVLNPLLQDIQQNSSQQQPQVFSYTKKMPPTSNLQSTTPQSLPVISSQIQYFQSFLLSLKVYQVYPKFLQQAFKKNILKKRSYKPKDYFQSYIQVRSRPINRHRHITSIQARSPLLSQPSSPKIHHLKVQQRPESGKSRLSNSHKSQTKQVHQPRSKIQNSHRSLLSVQNSALKQTFKYITRNSTAKFTKLRNISVDDLKVYLKERYPMEMVEIFYRLFNFSIALNLEQFVIELDKIYMMNQEKILKNCFDFFDYNKDKYICNNDLFMVIQGRMFNIFDQDLVLIRTQCQKKKKGELLPYKIKSRKKNQKLNGGAQEERPKVPHVHINRPQAITFQDFYRIIFPHERPQLFRDFMNFMTGSQMFQQPKSAYTLRRPSQDVILELSENSQKYLSDPKYPYFRQLKSTIQNFPDQSVIGLLLEKFQMMVCPSFKKMRVLSLNSIKQNWHKIFGTKNEYIQTAFYKILAGPEVKDITKSQFLQGVSLLFKEDKNVFAFKLYDKNMDGVLKADQVNQLFKTCPKSCRLYMESSLQYLSRLIDEFLLSIFDKRHQPLEGIDFTLFMEIVPVSCLVGDFYGALMTRKQELPYYNKSFNEIVEPSQEDVQGRRFIKYIFQQNKLKIFD